MEPLPKPYKAYSIYPRIGERPHIEWLARYLAKKDRRLSHLAVPYLVEESKRLQEETGDYVEEA